MTDFYNFDLTEDERPVLADYNSVLFGGLPTDDSGFVRITDPVTGVGLFNSNTDPTVVGIDNLTGASAPSGTDVMFGALIRRWLLAGLPNGDFAVPPPDPNSPVAADNILAYWKYVPAATGQTNAQVVPSTTGSGWRLLWTVLSGSEAAYFEILAPVNGSRGRSWNYLLSTRWDSGGGANPNQNLNMQYLKADAVTTTGSAFTNTVTVLGGENTLSASQVPTDGYWLRIRIGVTGNGAGFVYTDELRLLSGSDHVIIGDRISGHSPGVAYQDEGTLFIGPVMRPDPLTFAEVLPTNPYIAMSTATGAISITGPLVFPATQVPSSDANGLDDYEESLAWTPTLTFATAGDLNVVYSTRTATYIKIGRLVIVHVVIITSTFTHTTAAGGLQITGLPFAAATVAGHSWYGSCLLRYTKAGYTWVAPRVGSAGSAIVFEASGTGVAVAAIVAGDMPTGTQVTADVTVAYLASA